MKPKSKTLSFFRRLFLIPFAIAMLGPLFIFDFCLFIFHRITFAICKLKRVNRLTHFKVDQLKLAQMTKMQRIISVYTLYARGLMSYSGKIFQELEQLFCKPKQTKGRAQMMIDKSKMGVKELKAYQQSIKRKPKKSRKK